MGLNRLFVLEQPGRIRVILNDALQPQPFLDLTDRAGSQASEQGLLGLAFHPNFAQNGFFFVYYTDRQGDVWISRFQTSGESGDPRSEKRLLQVKQPYANHNGGALRFGPDGFLYIGLGDGGSQGDPFDNAQSGVSLLGKILRLDVDGGDPYALPADNPFLNASGFAPEIWALGLRNPWKIAFDPRGQLWIADVGQNEREEINRVPGGAPGGFNFGWNEMEGTRPYEGRNRPEFTPPIAEYTHALGCSVTGGERLHRNVSTRMAGHLLLWGFLQRQRVGAAHRNGNALRPAQHGHPVVPYRLPDFHLRPGRCRRVVPGALLTRRNLPPGAKIGEMSSGYMSFVSPAGDACHWQTGVKPPKMTSTFGGTYGRKTLGSDQNPLL